MRVDLFGTGVDDDVGLESVAHPSSPRVLAGCVDGVADGICEFGVTNDRLVVQSEWRRRGPVLCFGACERVVQSGSSATTVFFCLSWFASLVVSLAVRLGLRVRWPKGRCFGFVFGG